MESESQVKFYFGIVTAMLAFAIIAGGFILVVIRYQKRLMSNQRELLQRDAQHKQDLLLSSIQSAEAERMQIAKDVHDEIGSIFSTLSLSVNRLKAENNLQAEHIRMSKSLIQSGIDSVRRISHAIVPFELELLGLEQTLENHFETLRALSGIGIDFDNMAKLERLNKEATLAIYRIIQELSANCMKYAGAQKMSVIISEYADFVRIDYNDNGRGIDLEGNREVKGIGLKNIESRALLLSGSVKFISRPGEGFACRVIIPTKNNSLL